MPKKSSGDVSVDRSVKILTPSAFTYPDAPEGVAKPAGQSAWHSVKHRQSRPSTLGPPQIVAAPEQEPEEKHYELSGH